MAPKKHFLVYTQAACIPNTVTLQLVCTQRGVHTADTVKGQNTHRHSQERTGKHKGSVTNANTKTDPLTPEG